MAKSLSNQYITFILEDELLAFPAETLQEAVPAKKTTPIPCTPDYIEGILNLRGKIITIIDLRKKFNYKTDYTPNKNCFLIMNINVNNENINVGFHIDSVHKTITMDTPISEKKININSNIDSSCILGITTENEKTLTILCPEKIANFEVPTLQPNPVDARSYAPLSTA